MSESNTPDPSAPDGNEETPGAPDGNKGTEEPKVKTYTQAEIDEAIKRRDAAAKTARLEKEAREKLETQLGDLQKQIKELTSAKRKEADEEAIRAGDSERLRKSLEEQLAAKEAEIAAREAQVADRLTQAEQMVKDAKNRAFRAKAFEALSKVTDSPEPVWRMIQDHLEPIEDEGLVTIRAKDELYGPQEVDAFVLKFMEGNGLAPLIRSTRRAGSGMSQTTETTSTNGKTLTAAEIARQPDQGAAYFAKNPTAAAEYLRNIKSIR